MVNEKEVLQTSVIILILIGLIFVTWTILSFSAKILGIILIIGGGFIMFGLPDFQGGHQQRSAFTDVFVKFGAILVVIGLILLVFF